MERVAVWRSASEILRGSRPQEGFWESAARSPPEDTAIEIAVARGHPSPTPGTAIDEGGSTDPPVQDLGRTGRTKGAVTETGRRAERKRGTDREDRRNTEKGLDLRKCRELRNLIDS